jgi:hypothetical protein
VMKLKLDDDDDDLIHEGSRNYVSFSEGMA